MPWARSKQVERCTKTQFQLVVRTTVRVSIPEVQLLVSEGEEGVL